MTSRTSFRIPEAYETLLARVDRPGRYVGGEVNVVIKDPSRLRATIALAFPDLYDLGMSYHGFRILYEMINAREDVEATLAEVVAQAAARDVACSPHSRQGDPADAILDVAEETSADLIVVGNKGMTGAKRFLLGSVPNKVSHHAPCSVLIIRTT